MRRSILLVAVMITAVLLGSSAVTYAQQSDKAAPETTAPEETTTDTTAQDNAAPITIENHSWNGYHWARTANPFTLKLGDNVTSAWDSYLATTSSDWDQSSVLNTEIVDPDGTSASKGNKPPKKCAPTSGRVEVCNAEYGRRGWLGVATVWISGKHITQGTTKVNDTYFNTSTYNTPAWRNLVMCQEVGHTLGLDHQDEDFDNDNLGTCMDYTDDPESNQHPNQHDYDQLETIYEHPDSTTTVDASALSRKPPADDPGDEPSEWGREVYRSADGRVSLYELGLGKGQKKLTWVRWEEKEAKRRAKSTDPSGELTTANSPKETTASKGESTTEP